MSTRFPTTVGRNLPGTNWKSRVLWVRDRSKEEVHGDGVGKGDEKEKETRE